MKKSPTIIKATPIALHVGRCNANSTLGDEALALYQGVEETVFLNTHSLMVKGDNIAVTATVCESWMIDPIIRDAQFSLTSLQDKINHRPHYENAIANYIESILIL